MGTDAEHLVEVVVAVLRAGEVEARRVMGHVHVVDVLAHVRALDIGVVELGRAHGHHVGVHLHHEGDEAALADVVRQEARFVLGDPEDLVVGIVRDVVDLDIRVGEQPLDGTLEVLVEAASLRVEHEMLALDGEEALVVGALPPRMGVALVPLPLGRSRRFELLERIAGGIERRVIDESGGLDDGVAGELDGDGHEVRADPVERHAAGHEGSEAQRQRDRDAVGRRLLGAGLLVLEWIDAVSSQALDERREASEQRDDGEEREPRLGGHDAQQRHLGVSARGDGADDAREPEQDDDLYHQGHEREQRMVMALLVELVLLLLDGLAVAIEARLEIEEVRHELDHRDRVAMAPERDRHQEDLGDGCEEQDGDPPVARQPMAPFHDGIEDVGDRLDHVSPSNAVWGGPLGSEASSGVR